LRRRSTILFLLYPFLVYAGLRWGFPLAPVNQNLFLFFPSLVSFWMLGAFALSLRRPPSMIERFARLQVSSLSPQERTYCERVTKVWAVFFLLNGSLSVWIAAKGSLGLWTAYNGAISYGMVAGIFAVEYVWRHWLFPRQTGPVSAGLCRFLDRWRNNAA